MFVGKLKVPLENAKIKALSPEFIRYERNEDIGVFLEALVKDIDGIRTDTKEKYCQTTPS